MSNYSFRALGRLALISVNELPPSIDYAAALMKIGLAYCKVFFFRFLSLVRRFLLCIEKN